MGSVVLHKNLWPHRTIGRCTKCPATFSNHVAAEGHNHEVEVNERVAAPRRGGWLSPEERAEIAASTESTLELSKRFGVTSQTIYRWRYEG